MRQAFLEKLYLSQQTAVVKFNDDIMCEYECEDVFDHVANVAITFLENLHDSRQIWKANL